MEFGSPITLLGLSSDMQTSGITSDKLDHVDLLARDDQHSSANFESWVHNLKIVPQQVSVIDTCFYTDEGAIYCQFDSLQGVV